MQVDAEAVPDVAEQFSIEAVPAFVVVKVQRSSHKFK
jgi:thioredoxin-like negative regulator of GroEL